MTKKRGQIKAARLCGVVMFAIASLCQVVLTVRGRPWSDSS